MATQGNAKRKKNILGRIRDRAGQSTTEYILILAIVVMIAMRFRSSIKDRIEKATDKIGSQIDSAIQ